jgi:DnaJ like chaperone protein
VDRDLQKAVKTNSMGAGKWIGGFLGWVTLGPIGALLGFWFGAAVDGYIDRARQLSDDNETTASRRYYSADEQRNSFLVSLLVLSAAVIKADGKTLQAELDYVKEFVRKNFGDAAVPEAMRMLQEFTRQQVNIYQVGPQIARYMNYSQRLQLFHYLTQIALADGEFHKSEKGVLEAIGATIGLSQGDINSVISMFYKETNSAYTVLGVSPTASDDEVRTAYRRMAMKNHPDKVATLGPDVQKAAAEKFRQVQEAYETIKKERGIL